MVLSQACSKLACYRSSDDDSVLVHEKKLDELRNNGQQQLRAMLRRIDEGVDWKAVISKANELQEQEQACIAEKEKRDQEKRDKRALARRRRYEKTGSFSVNLLSFKPRTENHEVAKDDEMSTGLLSRARTRETRSQAGSQAGSHESVQAQRRRHPPMSIRMIEIKS